MGFASKNNRVSALLFPSSGDLPNSGNEPEFPVMQVDFVLTAEPPGKPTANFMHTENLLKKQLPQKSLN